MFVGHGGRGVLLLLLLLRTTIEILGWQEALYYPEACATDSHPSTPGRDLEIFGAISAIKNGIRVPIDLLGYVQPDRHHNTQLEQEEHCPEDIFVPRTGEPHWHGTQWGLHGWGLCEAETRSKQDRLRPGCAHTTHTS